MNLINFQNINRQNFIRSSGLLLGSLFSPIAASSVTSSGNMHESDNSILLPEKEPDELVLSSVPNFCSHEHWGSIGSMGFSSLQFGFRADTTAGALPLYKTNIWDLILDPYFNGWMNAAGCNPNNPAQDAGYKSQKEWWNVSPEESLKSFQKIVNPLLMSGGFQCTRKGIMHLYDIDIQLFELTDWLELDTNIKKHYSDIFSWYQEAMKKANFSGIIRPVHPEFYVQQETPESRQKERSFTNTILRIDPLLDLWQEKNPRRDFLANIVGTEPSDANSWREFILRLFDLAEKNHATGIKQLQAYGRSLLYQKRNDSEVNFRGNLDEKELIIFQDWVMHECCKQANERNWVHQIHVGTNNLENSSPLPLESLAQLYPEMNIVMLHCWPFLKEAGWLAKFIPNMYIDTCWLPVLNPAFFKEALDMWLNYVPTHKIMMAHDSTHVEMAVGSSLFTREILADSLLCQKKTYQVPLADLICWATDMLHNNAVNLYKIV